MTPAGGPRIERILVALDASPNSMAALEAAVALAAEHGATVVGVFVEDMNLVRLAQLPFAREVEQFTARMRDLGLEDLERQLQARAARAAQALAQAAGARGLAWDFRVTRGEISLELLAEGEQADFIVVGRSGWSGRRRLGSTARVLLSEAPRHVLVLQRGVRISRPVMTLYDGSGAAQRALESAALLAERESRGLTVLLLAEKESEAEELRSQAANWLLAREMAARFRWLPATAAGELARVVEEEGCLLVLPAELPLLEGEPLVEFIERIECPVMVVR